MDESLWDIFLRTQQFWVAFSFLGIAIWGAWYSWRRDRWKGRILTPAQVQDLRASGEDPLLWDARKPTQTQKDPETIKGALVMPLEQIPVRLRAKANHRLLRDLRTTEIIVFDNTLDRATLAAKLLQENGMVNVALMQGGLAAWRKAGLPTEPVAHEDEK